MQFPTGFGLDDWARMEPLSLESSSLCVDREALSSQRIQQLQAHWGQTVAQISEAGAICARC
jgi:hypothetical protein